MSGSADASAREGYVSNGSARLFFRDLGTGPPLMVLHGGPDFDHRYFLPEMDGLARSLRLVYYDQRGRGRSVDGVAPEDVTLASEVDDLEAVRRSLQLGPTAILGHSWGGVLAMAYAARYPRRVSHLILMNTAPATYADWQMLRERLPAMRAPGDLERLRALAAGAAFQHGDLEAEADYYRVHFSPTVRRPDVLDRIIPRLRASFTPAGVLMARAIEHRLYMETSQSEGFDLLSSLRGLDTPALIIHGEHDLIPVELVAHIADAMPAAQLAVLEGCGHFAYVERPDRVQDLIRRFLGVG